MIKELAYVGKALSYTGGTYVASGTTVDAKTIPTGSWLRCTSDSPTQVSISARETSSELFIEQVGAGVVTIAVPSTLKLNAFGLPRTRGPSSVLRLRWHDDGTVTCVDIGAAPPTGIELNNNNDRNIASGAVVYVTFDAVGYSRGIDPSNRQFVTVLENAEYALQMGGTFDQTNSGRRLCRIDQVNNLGAFVRTLVRVDAPSVQNAPTSLSASGTKYLTAGTRLGFGFFQDTGTPLALLASGTAYATQASIMRVGGPVS